MKEIVVDSLDEIPEVVTGKVIYLDDESEIDKVLTKEDSKTPGITDYIFNTEKKGEFQEDLATRREEMNKSYGELYKQGYPSFGSEKQEPEAAQDIYPVDKSKFKQKPPQNVYDIMRAIIQYKKTGGDQSPTPKTPGEYSPEPKWDLDAEIEKMSPADYKKLLNKAYRIESKLNKLEKEKEKEDEKFENLSPVGKGLRTLENLGAGVASAVSSIGEGVYRLPDSVNRIFGSIGINDPILDQISKFANPSADYLHKKQKQAEKKFRAFKRMTKKGKEAEDAMQDALKGDFKKLNNVLSDPEAWAFFIGQGIPSLAFAIASRGNLGAIAVLESTQISNDANELEKRLGIKISDKDFAHAFVRATAVNSLLERLGAKGFIDPGKSVFGKIAKGTGKETATEGTQEVSTNEAIKATYDNKRKLTQGLLGALMGGFGTGLGASALTAKNIEQPADVPPQDIVEDAGQLSEIRPGMPDKPQTKEEITDAVKNYMQQKYGFNDVEDAREFISGMTDEQVIDLIKNAGNLTTEEAQDFATNVIEKAQEHQEEKIQDELIEKENPEVKEVPQEPEITQKTKEAVEKPEEIKEPEAIKKPKEIEVTEEDIIEKLKEEPKDVAEKIDQQANEAATSPKNTIAEPTEEQKKAGNYKKGKVSVYGMEISVENPKGSLRKGKDADGKEWSTKMKDHYGYIKRTEGYDGDQVDVFINPNAGKGKKTFPQNLPVFVIEQVDPKTGKFDEHKVMIGYKTEESAKKAYLRNYEKGWKGLSKITKMKKKEFQDWVKSDAPKKRKPVASMSKEKVTTDIIDDTELDSVINQASDKTGTEVVLVNKSSDIPREARREFVEADERQIDAVFHDGKVYLVKGNLASIDHAKKVLAHELIGHKTFEDVFDDSFDELINKIATMNKKGKKMVRRAIKEVRKRHGILTEEEEAREVLAILSESKTKNSLVSRMTAKLARYIRSAGIDITLTDAELREMLANISRKSGIEEFQDAELKDIETIDDVKPFVDQEWIDENLKSKNAWKRFKASFEKLTPAFLAGLNILQLVEVGKRYFYSEKDKDGNVVGPNPLEYFGDLSTDIDGRRNELIDEVYEHADKWWKWANSNKGEAEDLAVIMNDTTVLEIDPVTDKLNSLIDINSAESKIKSLRDEIADIRRRGDRKKLQKQIKELEKRMRSRIKFAATAPQNMASQALKEVEDIKKEIEKIKKKINDNRLRDSELTQDQKYEIRQKNKEIRELNERIEFEKKRKKEFPLIKRRYNKLSDDAKEIYKKTRDQYNARFKQMEDALVNVVISKDIDEDKAAEEIAEIRKFFEEKRKRGPYFPLFRFGDYWIMAKKKVGKKSDYIAMPFGNKEDMRAAKKELEDKGYKVDTQVKVEEVAAAESAGEGFVRKVFKVIESAELAPEITSQLREAVSTLYIRTLPSVSMRKNMIRRKNVKGYSKEVIRGFAENMFHSAYQIAKIEFVQKINSALLEMGSQIKSSPNPIFAGRIYSEIKKSAEWMMSPDSSKIANKLNAIGFVWTLAGSVAAGAVNLSQTYLIGIPVIGAEYGRRKTTKELMRANRDFFSGQFHVEKSKYVTNDEKAALAEAVKKGWVTKTQAHDLMGLSEKNFDEYDPFKAKIRHALAFFFHHAERWNREVTYIAVYRMARQKGMTHSEAIKEGKRLVYDTHYNYSSANRARFMRSPTARVMLQFRQYSQNTTFLLGRNFQKSFSNKFSPEEKRVARRIIAGILVTHFAAGGIAAMPALWVLYSIIGFFGDDKDDPFDPETAIRSALADLAQFVGVDKKYANYIYSGPIGEFLGPSISKRITLNELWFRSPDFYIESEKHRIAYWLEQIAGPVAGLVFKGAKGFDFYAKGHTDRLVENVTPKFIGDLLKAKRYTTKGAKTIRGDTIMKKEDFSWLDLFWQGTGFTPSKLALKYDRARKQRKIQNALYDRRSSLMNLLYTYAKRKDIKNAKRVWKQMQRFGMINPGLRFSKESIIRSFKRRKEYSSMVEDGFHHTKKTYRRIKQKVRF